MTRINIIGPLSPTATKAIRMDYIEKCVPSTPATIGYKFEDVLTSISHSILSVERERKILNSVHQ